jgi:glycosyltransferase involved in cell wall biosynthesis
VQGLAAQADNLDATCEILLIDDCSTDGCRELNSALASLSAVRYIELNRNIGRSAIRNLLAREALYRYLIFMDSDAQLCSDDFLRKYLDCCHEGVVCYGGKKNIAECPAPDYRLRWLCSIRREEQSASERRRNPNRSFITYNFLIDKEIFNTVSFDESLKNSNHEDTIFGFRLSEAGIVVCHIDNQLWYCSFDDSAVFIEKTELGLQNLIDFYRRTENKAAFAAEVKALRVWRTVNAVGLSGAVAGLFRLMRSVMRSNLIGKYPSMFVFDLYKLGYLCSIA